MSTALRKQTSGAIRCAIAPYISVIEQREFAPFGPAVGWRFGNGLELDLVLDQDYRLTSQQTLPVQSLDFSYDDAGNILSIQDGADTARSQSFTYDVADRLVTATALGDYGTRAYGYDLLGNRVSRTADSQPEDTYAYAPDANRLTSITGPNAATFAYDAAGNTVTKGDLGFSYNDANRLSTVTLSGQPLASYLYNARGERVKKTVGADTRLFHYDLQ